MKAQSNISKRAAELNKQAIIIDAHCDILMPITDGKIRLNDRVDVPDSAAWQAPQFSGLIKGAMTQFSPHALYFGPIGQYSIPQFLEGGLTVQGCAIYLEDTQLDRALQRGLDMIWSFHREVNENENFEIVTSTADIRRIKKENKCGGILTLEGFEPLGSELRYLDIFYKLGLRIAGLTHSRRNAFADGTQSHIKTGGLTDLGKRAVKRMNELGIVIDLAHINQVGFWEVLELSNKPVIISHRNPREEYPQIPNQSPAHPRLDISQGPERLDALAKNGGVFGIIFWGLKDIDGVVEEIEYVIEMIGPNHVGLGSDLYGMDYAPRGLEDISKIPALTDALVQRGHSEEVILKFLGENYLRVFEQVWNE